MHNQQIEANLYELLASVENWPGIDYRRDDESGFVGVSHDSSAWPYMTVNVKDQIDRSDLTFVPELIKKQFPALVILGENAKEHEELLKQLSFRKISVWANMYIDTTANIVTTETTEVREVAAEELDAWKGVVEEVLFQKKSLDKDLFSAGMQKGKFKLFGAYTNENKLVGTLMIFMGSLPGVYMVATHKDYRKQGVAAGLVSAAIKYAHASGHTQLVLHSTVEGLPFYQKIGFLSTGNLSLYYYMNKS